jgi:hypothetical protein
MLKLRSERSETVQNCPSQASISSQMIALFGLVFLNRKRQTFCGKNIVLVSEGLNF